MQLECASLMQCVRVGMSGFMGSVCGYNYLNKMHATVYIRIKKNLLNFKCNL